MSHQSDSSRLKISNIFRDEAEQLLMQHYACVIGDNVGHRDWWFVYIYILHVKL